MTSTTPLTEGEMLACPWCGGRAYPQSPSLGRSAWSVVCDDCGAEGPPTTSDDAGEAAAIAAWNERTPTPSASDAKASELAGELERPAAAGLAGCEVPFCATFGCQGAIAPHCALLRAKSANPTGAEATPPDGELVDAAIAQNAAMRAELAHVGNLVSDLARAMRVDQANEDGSWPDLAGRIEKLRHAASLSHTEAQIRGSVEWLCQDDAEVELFQSIKAITIGNKTDDKLILKNLRARGVWLAKRNGND